MAEAETENGLLAIEVDADDYAETAAGDTPSVSRTYQSDADFTDIKATYQAKQDGHSTYNDLVSAVPALGFDNSHGINDHVIGDGGCRPKLSKKDLQLLGYAVGELYFDKEYSRVLELCERVRGKCEVDTRVSESLDKWERRCRERME